MFQSWKTCTLERSHIHTTAVVAISFVSCLMELLFKSQLMVNPYGSSHTFNILRLMYLINLISRSKFSIFLVFRFAFWYLSWFHYLISCESFHVFIILTFFWNYCFNKNVCVKESNYWACMSQINSDHIYIFFICFIKMMKICLELVRFI